MQLLGGMQIRKRVAQLTGDGFCRRLVYFATGLNKPVLEGHAGGHFENLISRAVELEDPDIPLQVSMAQAHAGLANLNEPVQAKIELSSAVLLGRLHNLADAHRKLMRKVFLDAKQLPAAQLASAIFDARVHTADESLYGILII